MCIRDRHKHVNVKYTEDGGAPPYDYAKAPLSHEDVLNALPTCQMAEELREVQAFIRDVYKRQVIW